MDQVTMGVITHSPITLIITAYSVEASAIFCLVIMVVIMVIMKSIMVTIMSTTVIITDTITTMTVCPSLRHVICKALYSPDAIFLLCIRSNRLSW